MLLLLLFRRSLIGRYRNRLYWLSAARLWTVASFFRRILQIIIDFVWVDAKDEVFDLLACELAILEYSSSDIVIIESCHLCVRCVVWTSITLIFFKSHPDFFDYHIRCKLFGLRIGHLFWLLSMLWHQGDRFQSCWLYFSCHFYSKAFRFEVRILILFGHVFIIIFVILLCRYHQLNLFAFMIHTVQCLFGLFLPLFLKELVLFGILCHFVLILNKLCCLRSQIKFLRSHSFTHVLGEMHRVFVVWDSRLFEIFENTKMSTWGDRIKELRIDICLVYTLFLSWVLAHWSFVFSFCISFMFVFWRMSVLMVLFLW